MTVPTSPAGEASQDPRRNIEAILPLHANQRALVLARDVTSEDPGFLQVRFSVVGELDLARFRTAWATVADWHPSLRSSIHGRSGAEPMQVVWRVSEIPWIEHDLTSVAHDDLASVIEDAAERDRASGLDLTTPPAMRIHLFPTSASRCEVVWTCHHLFLDGWSAALVLEDVMTAYHDPNAAPPSGTPGGLNRYSSWRRAGNEDEQAAYWSEALRGYEPIAPFRSEVDEESAIGPWSVVDVELPREVSAAVIARAEASRVTPGVVVEAAWARVLARLSGVDDVVFGTTVAGRAAPVDGMDRLVGYFSNAVPIRVDVDRSRLVDDWLRTLRDEQFAMRAHEHATLSDIQRWSGHPGGVPLFESFLVVENFPVGSGPADGPHIEGFRSGLTTSFPLTVAVTLGDGWAIHVRYATDRFGRDPMRRVAHAMRDALRDISLAGPDVRVGDLEELGLDQLVDASTSTGRVPTSHRGPTTDTERVVHEIWTELLASDAIGVDDDYFALGGTSIGAVWMFDEIERRIGATIAVSTLMRAPTIASLAASIDGTDASTATRSVCLVPIRPDGDRPPIIGIHAGVGHVMFYRSLAEALPPGQPFYAMEPVGLDGRETPLDSIPEMAARYVTEMRSLQPHGPYRLVGYCFGGTVALEMANQLEDIGESVETLVVIDGVPSRDAMRRDVIRSAKAAVKRVAKRGRGWWDGSFGDDEGKQRVNRERVAAACQRAFLSHRPEPGSTDVTVIKSSDWQRGIGPDLGWEPYAPSVDVIEVDAHHLRLFESPYVDQLAGAVSQRLDASTPSGSRDGSGGRSRGPA